MKFALLNRSSAPADAMVKIREALELHLQHVCAAWERLPITVAWYPDQAVAPLGEIALIAFDDPDQPGAEGYHDVDPRGVPYGRAFLNVIPGRALLYDPSGRGQCLAAVLEHEADEIVGDTFAADWSDGPFVDVNTNLTRASVARELCDPVQDSAYDLVLADGTRTSATNFVFPAWFDGKSIGERYDFMNIIKAALTLAPGGYAIARNAPGSETSVENDERSIDAWRLAHSNACGSRRTKRIKSIAKMTTPLT